MKLKDYLNRCFKAATLHIRRQHVVRRLVKTEVDFEKVGSESNLVFPCNVTNAGM